MVQDRLDFTILSNVVCNVVTWYERSINYRRRGKWSAFWLKCWLYRCTSKSTFILFKCSEIFSITMHKYGQYVLLNATPVFTKHSDSDCDFKFASPQQKNASGLSRYIHQRFMFVIRLQERFPSYDCRLSLQATLQSGEPPVCCHLSLPTGRYGEFAPFILNFLLWILGEVFFSISTSESRKWCQINMAVQSIRSKKK